MFKTWCDFFLFMWPYFPIYMLPFYPNLLFITQLPTQNPYDIRLAPISLSLTRCHGHHGQSRSELLYGRVSQCDNFSQNQKQSTTPTPTRPYSVNQHHNKSETIWQLFTNNTTKLQHNKVWKKKSTLKKPTKTRSKCKQRMKRVNKRDTPPPTPRLQDSIPFVREASQGGLRGQYRQPWAIQEGLGNP